MLYAFIFLIGGLIGLVFAGDFLVRGAVSVATRFQIPTLIIGLTIVAFGTSAPELMISITAAFDNAPGIAVGNVIGSNIANVLLVLGLPSLFAITKCCDEGAMKAVLFMVAITLIFMTMASTDTISPLFGSILLVFLSVYLVMQFYDARKAKKQNPASMAQEETAIHTIEDLDGVDNIPTSMTIAALFLIGGLIGLPIAAHFTIEGATQIASFWGLSQTLIGLTIVAFGTSLPELATALMAALRGHSGVGLGNIVGSNIFNILAILGMTSVLIPLPVDPQLFTFDFWVFLASTLLLIPLAFYKTQIGKSLGSVLTLSYCAYIAITTMISL